MLPRIKGFIENTLIDWPGRIAAEIFLPGCNFRCPFCHAVHLVLQPNELESIQFESIRQYLAKRTDWIDGVVISGGEPTICDGIGELVDAMGELGFPVKLDTNGSQPDVLEGLIKGATVQAVSMDIKAPLDERYNKLAGVEVDLGAIRRSIDLLLSGAAAEYEFRTTVPPGFLDDEAILDIAASIEGAEAYVLQAFRSAECVDSAMNAVRSADPESLKPVAERAGTYVKRCWVRGFEMIQPEVGPSHAHPHLG